MPTLTRRRSDNPHRETWHIHFDDVQVGPISERSGVPVDRDQWQWSCGFYPGLHPGQHRYGVAPTLAEARAGFEAHWNRLQAEMPEGALDEYRHDREMRAEIRAKRARGGKARQRNPHLNDEMRLRNQLRQSHVDSQSGSLAAHLCGAG